MRIITVNISELKINQNISMLKNLTIQFIAASYFSSFFLFRARKKNAQPFGHTFFIKEHSFSSFVCRGWKLSVSLHSATLGLSVFVLFEASDNVSSTLFGDGVQFTVSESLMLISTYFLNGILATRHSIGNSVAKKSSKGMVVFCFSSFQRIKIVIHLS